MISKVVWRILLPVVWVSGLAASVHAQSAEPGPPLPPAPQPTVMQPEPPPVLSPTPPAPTSPFVAAPPPPPPPAVPVLVPSELPTEVRSKNYGVDIERHWQSGSPWASAASGFTFGSYGRILAGTDLRGGKPEAINVVAYGPRVVEKSYLELDFRYSTTAWMGHPIKVVSTVAFDDSLFHANGKFEAHPAIRNMYAEAEVNLGVPGSLWIGSRIYSGDDIYLLDYWPLNDQNTVGAGATARTGRLAMAAHVGWNRLDNEFQFQEVTVPDPAQGQAIVAQLNRQRTTVSATVDYMLRQADKAKVSVRARLHGELQWLPSGTRQLESDATLEALPSDFGFTVGAELSAFGLVPDYAADNENYRRFVNVFARLSKGLTAFDELATPTSFGSDFRTTGASEIVIGASANFDHERLLTTIGYLSRRFVDADLSSVDADDAWEHVLVARPLVPIPVLKGTTTTPLFIGADVSYQVRFARGPNASTGLIADAAELQLAPMVVYSPTGRSAYDRPQLRLVYRASHLNQAARDNYVAADPRREHEWVHYLGVQAEWWFGSNALAGDSW